MNVLRHPALGRAAQLAIGLVFCASALAKIADLGAFATQLQHYRLLPLAGVNLAAITLPWIELLAGLALVLGVRARSGAWLALAMLVVFTAAVGLAVARGLDFACGCFGTADAARVGARKLAENAGLIAVAVVGALRRD